MYRLLSNVLFLFFLSTQLFSAEYIKNGHDESKKVTFELGIVINKETAVKYGVGTLVSMGSSQAVVTAAHIVAVADDTKPNIIFLIPESNENNKYKKYIVSNTVIHPEFRRSFYDSRSGYDIALLMVTKTDTVFGKEYFIDDIVEAFCPKIGDGTCTEVSASTISSKNPVFPSQQKIFQDDKLIVGTPSYTDKILKYSFFKAPIHKIFSGSSKSGKIVSYHGLPSKAGHSGSPIFRDVGSSVELIGVHAGIHQVDKFAFGTLITNRIWKWIEESINKQ